MPLSTTLRRIILPVSTSSRTPDERHQTAHSPSVVSRSKILAFAGVDSFWPTSYFQSASPSHFYLPFTESNVSPRFLAWMNDRPSPPVHTVSIPSHILFLPTNRHLTRPLGPPSDAPGLVTNHITQTFDCVVEVPSPSSFTGPFEFGMNNRFRSEVPLSPWFLSTLYLDRGAQAQEVSLLSTTQEPAGQGPVIQSAEVGQSWWERILGSEASKSKILSVDQTGSSTGPILTMSFFRCYPLLHCPVFLHLSTNASFPN
jgi:hypothetical protein